MAENRFQALRGDLLSAGVAPRHVERLVEELEDHQHDLLRAELEKGTGRGEASSRSAEILGSNEDIVAATRLRPELFCWSERWPFLRSASRPFLVIAMAPLIPIAGLVERGDVVSRWICAIVGGGLVTAATLFLMQLSITLG